MIAAGGVLHIFHNAANTTTTASKILEEAIDELAECCRMLSDEAVKKRIDESVLDEPSARPLRIPLRKFRVKIHKKRWGTVAFGCERVQTLNGMRQRWSRAKYESVANSRNERPNEDGRKMLDTLDRCMTSDFWLAKIITASHIFMMVRGSFAWAERCTCHGELLMDENLPSKVRARWEACCMKCLRLHEISCGGFFEYLHRLFQSTICHLLEALPSGITCDERGSCIQEFERGRAGFYFQLTLKLTPFAEPPSLLFGLAHPLRSKHERALRICLRSSCQHPRLLELTSEGDLRNEAFAFLEGCPLADVPQYATYRGVFKFGWCGEREVEAGHALVNLRAAKSRNRTEAYDSLSIRMPTMIDGLGNQDYLEKIINAIGEQRTPLQLCQSLHFQHHPSFKLSKGTWDTIYRKIIYHNDPYTLYRRDRPPLRVMPLEPPAPPPPGPPPPPPPPGPDNAPNPDSPPLGPPRDPNGAPGTPPAHYYPGPPSPGELYLYGSPCSPCSPQADANVAEPAPPRRIRNDC